MAQNRLLTASGAIGASGQNVRVYRVLVCNDGVGNGTCTLKTGGTSGTQVGPIIATLQGHSEQIHLPGLVADFATLVNCEILVEFAKGSVGG